MEDFPDFEQTRGSNAPDEGYQENKGSPHAAFVRYDLPETRPAAVTIRPGNPIPSNIALTDTPLTPIKSTYLPAIKKLCEENGAILVFLQLPMADSNGLIEISSQVLALGVPIIAASAEAMFGNIPIEHKKYNYSDHIHFNSNGARQSARVFGPALQALLEQTRG